jgi:hypothetical protein
MHVLGHKEMICPFCHGRVTRVVKARPPVGWRARIGQALLADIFFWCVAVVLVAVSFWSFLAGVLLFALVAMVWFRWEPHRAAYRCEACQSVLTYQEVKRVHTDAA